MVREGVVEGEGGGEVEEKVGRREGGQCEGECRTIKLPALQPGDGDATTCHHLLWRPPAAEG